MIDFRYHFVSIVAIFLALGLGVLAGTTVLDRVTVDALRGQVNGLRQALDRHRADITDLQERNDRAGDLVAALAPRVTEGVLVGMRVLFVTGDGEADWHRRARTAIADAGAQDVGTVRLTERWALEEPADRRELAQAFGGAELSEREPAGDAARRLGEALGGGGSAAEAMVEQLSERGFVQTARPDEDAAFPPPAAQLVVLTSGDDSTLAALARGAAAATPTLVLAGSTDALGPLEQLREREDDSGRLATFDSAADDPSGVGTVLALRAAADNAGGHFGRGPGTRYLPAPP